MKSQTTRVPVQARALRTRAELLSAASQEFAASGYAGTNARSIAARAGMAAGTFYQYFEDKDAALRELAAARMADLHGRINRAALVAGSGQEAEMPRSAEAMRASILEVLDYHRADKGLHAVLGERRTADPKLDALTSASEGHFVGSIEYLLGAWNVPVDSRRPMAYVIFSMIEGAVHGHVLGTAVLTDQQLVDELCDTVAAMIAAKRQE